MDRRRKYLLTFAVALLGLIIWKMAIKQTVLLAKNNVILRSSIEETKTMMLNSDSLGRQIDNIEHGLLHFGPGEEFQRDLMVRVSEICAKTNVKLVIVEQVEYIPAGNFRIMQSRFGIVGSFKDCIQAIYKMEVGKKIGKMTSCTMSNLNKKRERKYSTDKNIINVSIVIESLVL